MEAQHLENTTADTLAASAFETAGLRCGQEVRVRCGAEDLGAGIVDAITEDGSIAWVIFSGATGRRMFMAEDQAQFTVLPPTSVR